MEKESVVEPQEKKAPVVLNDCGAASVVTRGLFLLWPWFENSPPPFNHYCPVCGS
jgi:hypothetical protein